MNDAPMAELLLNDLPAGADVLADKGYDADWIRIWIIIRLHTTHPAEIKPLRRHHLQQNEIQEAQPYRALLQQAQRSSDTSQPDTTAARSQLSRHDQNRLRPSLAQVL